MHPCSVTTPTGRQCDLPVSTGKSPGSSRTCRRRSWSSRFALMRPNRATDAEAITDLKDRPCIAHVSSASAQRQSSSRPVAHRFLRTGVADPVLPRTIEFAQRNNTGSVAHLLCWSGSWSCHGRLARANRLAWIGTRSRSSVWSFWPFYRRGHHRSHLRRLTDAVRSLGRYRGRHDLCRDRRKPLGLVSPWLNSLPCCAGFSSSLSCCRGLSSSVLRTTRLSSAGACAVATRSRCDRGRQRSAHYAVSGSRRR